MLPNLNVQKIMQDAHVCHPKLFLKKFFHCRDLLGMATCHDEIIHIQCHYLTLSEEKTRFESDGLLINWILERKELILWYQALGACFSP